MPRLQWQNLTSNSRLCKIVIGPVIFPRTSLNPCAAKPESFSTASAMTRSIRMRIGAAGSKLAKSKLSESSTLVAGHTNSETVHFRIDPRACIKRANDTMDVMQLRPVVRFRYPCLPELLVQMPAQLSVL